MWDDMRLPEGKARLAEAEVQADLRGPADLPTGKAQGRAENVDSGWGHGRLKRRMPSNDPAQAAARGALAQASGTTAGWLSP
jgi:hypothetical protein